DRRQEAAAARAGGWRRRSWLLLPIRLRSARCVRSARRKLSTLSPCGRGSPARSAGGVRGAVVQNVEEHGQNSLDVRQHFVIPETLHKKIIRRQPAIALLITRRICMLTAIHFDHEACAETDEIADEGTERNLPTEFEIGEPSIT